MLFLRRQAEFVLIHANKIGFIIFGYHVISGVGRVGLGVDGVFFRLVLDQLDYPAGDKTVAKIRDQDDIIFGNFCPQVSDYFRFKFLIYLLIVEIIDLKKLLIKVLVYIPFLTIVGPSSR